MTIVMVAEKITLTLLAESMKSTPLKEIPRVTTGNLVMSFVAPYNR